MMSADEVAELEATLEPDEAPKPKRRGRPPGRKPRKRSTPRPASNKPPSLRMPLRAMFETVGSVWHMSELTRGHVPLSEDYPTCGSVLVAQADSLASNLNTLAQTDPSVYKWLDRMMAGGGWGGVVLAAWPVAQAVLQSHVMPTIERRREAMVEAASPDGEGEWSPPEPS